MRCFFPSRCVATLAVVVGAGLGLWAQDFPSVVVGVDPGGTEVLRVGGQSHLNGAVNVTGDAVVHGTFSWGTDGPWTYMYGGAPNKIFAYTDLYNNILYSGVLGLGINNAADTVRLAHLTDLGNFGIGCSTAVAAKFHVAGGTIDRDPAEWEVMVGGGEIRAGGGLRCGVVNSTQRHFLSSQHDQVLTLLRGNGADTGITFGPETGGITALYGANGPDGKFRMFTGGIESLAVASKQPSLSGAKAEITAIGGGQIMTGDSFVVRVDGTPGNQRAARFTSYPDPQASYSGMAAIQSFYWDGSAYLWRDVAVFTASGNVGIGTNNPTEKLAVNGTIRAKEVRVENTGWGDYVFAPDYKLLSLGEVAQHIAQNRHLPGIPSAADIEKNGLGVSDMVSKQMVKIEELTLYAIQAKQERDAMATKAEAMAAKVDRLEAELTEIRALLRAK